jgi:hypothetical protein
MNRFKSVLLIPPIGFKSALEQLPLISVRARRLVDLLVFRQISPQTLIDVGTAQDEQSADLASRPGEQLGKHVSYHHTQSGLPSVQLIATKGLSA